MCGFNFETNAFLTIGKVPNILRLNVMRMLHLSIPNSAEDERLLPIFAKESFS